MSVISGFFFFSFLNIFQTFMMYIYLYLISFLTLWHNSSSKGVFFEIEGNGSIVISNITIRGSNSAPTSYINYNFLIAGGGFNG
jgi:hypothetical protein